VHTYSDRGWHNAVSCFDLAAFRGGSPAQGLMGWRDWGCCFQLFYRGAHRALWYLRLHPPTAVQLHLASSSPWAQQGKRCCTIHTTQLFTLDASFHINVPRVEFTNMFCAPIRLTLSKRGTVYRLYDDSIVNLSVTALDGQRDWLESWPSCRVWRVGSEDFTESYTMSPSQSSLMITDQKCVVASAESLLCSGCFWVFLCPSICLCFQLPLIPPHGPALAGTVIGFPWVES